MYKKSFNFVLALCVAGAHAQTYSATYLPSNAPKQTEQGQAGTNQCGGGSNQTSQCQNAYINSVDDWCVFAPPEPGPGSVIGNTERFEVSWCIKSGYGTRVIPDGAITGAHFVQTPDYVQITGVGDLTKINIPAGDAGGELDPHGADGNGNPIGGLVFSSAFTGSVVQLHEWTNFVSDSEFCFRGCKDGPNAPALCEHIYDVMGCFWNMPGDYDAGSFSQCKGDSGEPMGVYGTSTFFQGEPNTPPAHPAPATSSCTPVSTIGNGLAVSGAPSSSAASTVGISSSSPVSSSLPASSSAVTSPPSSSNATNSSSASSSQTSGVSTTSPGVSTTGSSSRGASSSLATPTGSTGASIMGARAPPAGTVFGIVLGLVGGVMGATLMI